jgi:hypothetical protein
LCKIFPKQTAILIMRTILIFCPTAKAETLNHAFRLAAQTVGRSQTALGGFHRRPKAHLGAPKVSTATAYELARMFYMLWTSGDALDFR